MRGNDLTTSSQAVAPPVYPADKEPRLDGSRLASLQRAVVGLTEIVEDSIDLFGATVREEAARIPGALIRPAAGFLTVVVGVSFLTAAAAFYLRDLFGGWAPSFLALGTVYAVLGLVVWKTGGARP
jgi:Putative Actinobacterial Holin-X, holin superfamily III